MEYLKSLALFLFSSLLTIGLFEAGLRVIAARPEDLSTQLRRSESMTPNAEQGNTSLAGLIRPSSSSDIVYELKPNLTATFQGQPLTTNTFGMRERPVHVEKERYRIAGIGDSVIFGWGVKAEDTYLRRLETLLTADGKPIETLNFGCPGYNTPMEIALIKEKVLQFAPDLLLIHFISNDYDVPAFMLKQEDPYDFSKSFLIDFLSARLSSSQGEHRLFYSVQSLSQRKDREAKKVREAYHQKVGKKAVLRAFQALAHLAQRQNLPVTILYGKVSKDQLKLLKSVQKRYRFGLISVGDHVEAALKKRGIPNTPAIRKEKLTVSPTDRHPSALGHEIIAEALAADLPKLVPALRSVSGM